MSENIQEAVNDFTKKQTKNWTCAFECLDRRIN